MQTTEAAFVRPQPGQATGVARYLNSMIFWQDQVEVADLSRETAQFGVYGPRSGELLAGLTGLDLAAAPSYGWRAGRIAAAEITLHRCGPLEAPAWMIVAASTAAPRVAAALAAAAPELAAGDADLLRIEAGIPTWGRELSDGVTPLETGLLPAISFNKGCYTGQEVIARQTNYDKVTRNLVGLILDAPPPFPSAPGGGQGWGTVPVPAAAASWAAPPGRPPWAGTSPWPSCRVSWPRREAG